MLPGFPIRIPLDQSSLAANQEFSQPVASFIASENLGIPHAPFVTLKFTYLVENIRCSFIQLLKSEIVVSGRSNFRLTTY